MFNAVATVRNEDIHKQMIDTRELGPGASLIAILTSTLDANRQRQPRKEHPLIEHVEDVVKQDTGGGTSLKQNLILVAVKAFTGERLQVCWGGHKSSLKLQAGIPQNHK